MSLNNNFCALNCVGDDVVMNGAQNEPNPYKALQHKNARQAADAIEFSYFIQLQPKPAKWLKSPFTAVTRV